MLVSAVCYSFAPLLISGGRASVSPFFFNAFWDVGLTLGCFGYLILFFRRDLFRLSQIRIIAQSSISFPILWGIGNGLDYTLFTFATRLVDVSIAVVLLETWPIFLMLALAIAFRSGKRYRENLTVTVSLAFTALAGFLFVVLSQSGGLDVGDSSILEILGGAILAILAAAISGFGAGYVFSWGVGLAQKMRPNTVCESEAGSLELMGTVMGYGLSHWVAGVLLFVLGISPLNAALSGISLGETADIARMVEIGTILQVEFPVVLIALIGGLTSHTGGAVFLRLSNLTTDNLGVNVLAYLIPVISLVWLALFSQINVARMDYLIIGTAAIVSANLLINFEAERLLGFKALVMSLWTCGTVVFLRKTDGWDWIGKSDS